MSSRPRRRVCLVTTELYPFTAGGIGRLVYNFIRDGLERQSGVEYHVLVPCWSKLEPAAVEARFGGRVRLHKAHSLDSEEHRSRFGRAYPARWAFSDTPHHADSLELMLALKALEEDEGLRFDAVEFPDYLGFAFCSIMEKRLGQGFAATTLGVRLHSTAGLIEHHEASAPTPATLGLFELERRSLLEADFVVGHLPAVVDANQQFYGFDDGWRQRVRVEWPPILVDGAGARPARALPANANLVFATKIQPFKRPDLFVRGAALFMLDHPEFTGKAVLACHVTSEEYASRIRRLVPRQLAKRFVFTGPRGREELMRDGVVVISSDYESLNLTAYEASELGATLVLNAACPAFAPGGPFVDGTNCHTFDGTPESLAQALERALTLPRPERVRVEAVAPWFESGQPAAAPLLAEAGKALVSVLITNHNLAAYLPQAIESIAASTYGNVEVVVVDDASTGPLDEEVLRAIESRASDALPVRVIRNRVNRGLAASRNIGLKHCRGELVMPLDADDRIAPHFLETAVRALTGDPRFDVVVPTTGYFKSDDALESRDFSDFACFLGDTPTLGLLHNRFSCATALIRRPVLERFRYDEAMDSYEDWSLYARMAHAGVRFLVTNDVQFHYRRREGSMIRGIDAGRHQRLLARLYDGLPRPLSPAVMVRGFATLQVSAPVAHAPPEVELPLRYRLADAANEVVKRSPRLHHQLKSSAPPPTLAEKPLRYEVADRLNDLVKQLPGMQAILRRSMER